MSESKVETKIEIKENQVDVEKPSLKLLDTPIDKLGSFTDMKLVGDFISATEELNLFRIINKQTWSDILTRKTQQYGHVYNYAKPREKPYKTDVMPEWLQFLIDRMIYFDIFDSKNPPNQCIINDYEPPQGIASHTDNQEHFGPVICSLTLNSGIVMKFTNQEKKEHGLYLPRRSLLVLKGKSRTDVMHGIDCKKTDTLNGIKMPRGHRISITFRTMKIKL